MAIFISYSHSDRTFASRLATRLAKNNAHVWIDSWELNVGDSLIDRIQNAIQNAGALLVILSKASVESEWCKKELNAALVRELEEKRVIVLPVLKEECSIPMFLREKKYADFRGKFDAGFADLLSAVARVINTEQGRILSESATTDWAETWNYVDDAFHLEWELVESTSELAFTILTTISVTCNEAATGPYREYEKQGLDWIGRMIITDSLALLSNNQDLHVRFEDARPKIVKFALQDSHSDLAYYIVIRCRRMGEDNGKDQLVRVSKITYAKSGSMSETFRALLVRKKGRSSLRSLPIANQPGAPGLVSEIWVFAGTANEAVGRAPRVIQTHTTRTYIREAEHTSQNRDLGHPAT